MPCTSDLFDNVHTMCSDTKLPSMLQYIPIAKNVAHCIKCWIFRCAHPDHTTSIVHATFINPWSGKTIQIDSMGAHRHPSLFKLNLMRTSDTQLSLRSMTPLHSLSYQPMCKYQKPRPCMLTTNTTADILLIHMKLESCGHASHQNSRFDS